MLALKPRWNNDAYKVTAHRARIGTFTFVTTRRAGFSPFVLAFMLIYLSPNRAFGDLH